MPAPSSKRIRMSDRCCSSSAGMVTALFSRRRESSRWSVASRIPEVCSPETSGRRTGVVKTTLPVSRVFQAVFAEVTAAPISQKSEQSSVLLRLSPPPGTYFPTHEQSVRCAPARILRSSNHCTGMLLTRGSNFPPVSSGEFFARSLRISMSEL